VPLYVYACAEVSCVLIWQRARLGRALRAALAVQAEALVFAGWQRVCAVLGARAVLVVVANTCLGRPRARSVPL
jgi:hypothetical protein